MVFRKDQKIREAFDKVREEFDVHLDTINANTSEIHENRAMILAMQERLCKLADQITELRVMFEHSEPDAMYGAIRPLSIREQEVFLAIYTAGDLVSEERISRMLGLPVSHIREICESIREKEVPLRMHVNERDMIFYSLDPEFRETQARQNILGIDESLSVQWIKDYQSSLLDN